MTYYILTCDLVRSREVTRRLEAQEELKTVIKLINEVFKKKILSPFVIVWGDSFQGALKSLSDFYAIIESFEENLSVKFRCGIGIGTITTIFSPNTLEMDGPAFHRSQEALEFAKEEKHSVWIKSEKSSFDKVVNALLILLSTIKSGWTSKQKAVIYLRKQDLTYKDIGKRRNITKQAVSNILKSAHWKEVALAIETLNNLTYGSICRTASQM
ncbi:MAG: SatD family protein [Candidatus Heimdallarchaeota archaeon]